MKGSAAPEDERMKILQQRLARRSVLLALGWNVAAINQGVAEYAKKANWILDDNMCHSGIIPTHWSGDGIITMIIDPDEQPLIRLIEEKGVPVVNLGPLKSPLIRCRVMPDNEMIGAQAAEHLLSRGFNNFAFFCVSSFPVVQERMQGFRKVIEKAGKKFFKLDFVPKSKTDFIDRDQYLELIANLSAELVNLPLPLAVMSQYDAEANDVVRACLTANLRIPDDVAVIGVDNDPIYSMLGPIPLSSVNNNLWLAGYRAAEALDQVLDGVLLDETTIRIKPEGVTVRESTDIVAIADIYVSKALRFIVAHYRENISVTDVVSNSGISRRGLYSRFEMNVGRSIYQELMKRRIEYAMQLLRDTDHKLHFIAEACGLGDAERLSKSFKRCCDVTPFAYRTEHREKARK